MCVPGGLNRATAAFSATAPATVTRKVAAVIVKRAEK